MANNDVRKFTNKLYDLVEEGLISPTTFAEMCLSYMSEADVADMCRANDLFQDEDEEDEEEEEGEE